MRENRDGPDVIDSSIVNTTGSILKKGDCHEKDTKIMLQLQQLGLHLKSVYNHISLYINIYVRRNSC